jgi:CheY-like chemotaxis protein
VEKSRPTFLLVEDDPSDIFLMQRACQKAKLTDCLQIVTDGKMAVDYLAGIGKFADRSQYPLPSLVFLDLKLPYRSGFDVLRWMRTQPALQSVVVVILSSSSEEQDMDTAYPLGARSYLVKPPTPKLLLDVLNQFEISWAKCAEPQPAR